MAATVSILSTNTHSSGVQTLQSQKVKGDAYFGQNDGLHTVMIQLSNFVGTIKIQSSLEETPGDNDWFDAELGTDDFSVDTTGLIKKTAMSSIIYPVPETSLRAYNTRGNYVWLRADISQWTAGTINRIELNR